MDASHEIRILSAGPGIAGPDQVISGRAHDRATAWEAIDCSDHRNMPGTLAPAAQQRHPTLKDVLRFSI